MIRTMLVVLGLTLGLSGCVTNYEYRAWGETRAANDEPVPSVIYWKQDEGWWWGRYSRTDTSPTLRSCQRIPKPLSLADDGVIEMTSRAGDLLVATLGRDGTLEPLESARVQPDGERCGLLMRDGKPASLEDLGTRDFRPQLGVLCENPSRPDRYPRVAVHAFEPPVRHKSSELAGAPDPCLARPSGRASSAVGDSP
ncbi:hypothetical protein GCM10007160_15740 [Litchfieldella qijiaojingensis]|uniref:Lipoprotein n=1 Tax=Litchfieldella qijiaojingensis TaxID=980347 RepID=A0ABQ2YN40_9GAMM|nr:hypothetical protein [Halomonas qijiaojingensis]GGX89233.1 hypothetical protein GCM10007160_15740 [Halomonas qijiaojingensis]